MWASGGLLARAPDKKTGRASVGEPDLRAWRRPGSATAGSLTWSASRQKSSLVLRATRRGPSASRRRWLLHQFELSKEAGYDGKTPLFIACENGHADGAPQ